MDVVAALALLVVALAPFVILWRCGWNRTAVGFVCTGLLIAVATAVGFVVVEDSPECDDVCEELVPLILGITAGAALDVVAWVAAVIAVVRRRTTRS